jgi:hypothetical protein
VVASWVALILIIEASIVALVNVISPHAITLHYGFGGVPHDFNEVSSIFFTNLPILLAIGGPPILTEWARVGDKRDSMPMWWTVGWATVAWIFALWNLLNLGEALGVYGWRAISAIWLHAIFELGAFILAGAVHRRYIREQSTLGDMILAMSVATASLALAAFLEVWT